MFRYNLASTRGKTTHKQSEQVVTDYVEVPHTLKDLKKDAVISTDVMFV